MKVQRQKFCKKCKRLTIHTFDQPSHVLHLLLTLCTFGIWLIVWALCGVEGLGGGKCEEHKQQNIFLIAFDIALVFLVVIYILS